MKRFRVTAFALFLTVGCYSSVSSAQMYKCQTRDGRTSYQEQPCAGDARQATVKKPSAATGAAPEAMPGTKLRAEETAVLCAFIEMNLAQVACILSYGKFCTVEELATGIGPQKKRVLSKDPRLDPNYEHRIEPRGDAYTWSAMPRNPQLKGFFYDGKRTYFNPNGKASSKDKVFDGDINCK